MSVEPLLTILQRILHGLLLLVIGLAPDALLVLKRLLHGLQVGLESYLGVHLRFHLLVLLLKLLGFADHFLNLCLVEPATIVADRDGHRLLTGHDDVSDLQYPIGVDAQSHFVLAPLFRAREAIHVELTKQVVVLRHGPFALVHCDGRRCVLNVVRVVPLGFLRRDDGIAWDDLVHEPSCRLYAQSQRRDVEQDDASAVGLTAQDAALHGRTVGDSLVGVHALVRLLAIEELLDQLLHLRDPGGTSDQHDVVDLGLPQARILQHLLHRTERLLK
mmetsp:Transcript_40186/g.104745  ORF Transcript_40186/g.104745 Transcript_40186/m.104745 type:complete len:274 (+) Transcript_40186:289-1110(+)